VHRSLTIFLLAIIFYPSTGEAQTWTGKVSDIRTGAVLANARVCAGIKGRVDLSCNSSTGVGTFEVNYPKPMALGSDNLYYLYVERPLNTPYFHQKRARAEAGAADVQLIPTTVYIRGRVVSAETGQALSGVGVALLQPGRIDHTVTSDAAGEFAFKAVKAFQNPILQFNTYGVPEADLPAENDGELVYAVWGLRAPYGAGGDLYAKIEPVTTSDRRFVPELPMISSAVPESYTWVELRLPPIGTTISNVGAYIDAQIGRPAPKLDAGVQDAEQPVNLDATLVTVDATLITVDATLGTTGYDSTPVGPSDASVSPIPPATSEKASSGGCSVMNPGRSQRVIWGLLPFLALLTLRTFSAGRNRRR
jgi:hypothetical protein